MGHTVESIERNAGLNTEEALALLAEVARLTEANLQFRREAALGRCLIHLVEAHIARVVE